MKSGSGRVAILMDIDYLGSSRRVDIVQNLENFLDHGTSCSSDTSAGALSWSPSSPRGCTTLLTPKEYSWGATSSAGNITFAVKSTGVTTSCVSVQGGTSSINRCQLTGATAAGGVLSVIATDNAGSSLTRRYRVVPQNDPRNVASGFSLDSNWWDWPDADGDGLPDNWETNGVYVGNRYLDLRSMGFQSTMRK